MNEQISRVRTPETVGAEIRNLTSAARYLNVYYAVEIGRRLTEAKELVAHGEWLSWLKTETEFSQPTASRFMRVYAEYGADQGNLFGAETKYSTLNNLSVSNALRLLAVPEEEREEFALEVDAEHLSAKELEEAIRERDEAKQALKATAEELEEAQRLADEETARADASEKLRAELADKVAGKNMEIEAAKKKIAELERRPIDVAVQEPDPAEIERRAIEIAKEAREKDAARIAELERAVEDAGPYKARAEEAEAKVKAAEEKAKAERDKLKEKLKAAEEKLAGAGAEDKAAADKLRGEVEALKKQLAMSDTAVVTFKLRFQQWQADFTTLMSALRALPEESREKCKGAIAVQLDNWKGAM